MRMKESKGYLGKGNMQKAFTLKGITLSLAWGKRAGVRSLFRAVTLRSGIGLAQCFRVEQQGENLMKKGWNLDVSSHMLVLVHQESTRMCREVVEIDQSHAPSLEIGDID